MSRLSTLYSRARLAPFLKSQRAHQGPYSHASTPSLFLRVQGLFGGTDLYASAWLAPAVSVTCSVNAYLLDSFSCGSEFIAADCVDKLVI